MDSVIKFCTVHIEGIIGALLSIIIYLVSRRDGNKSAQEYKSMFLNGQKENIKLQRQLELRVIEHDKATADLQKNVSVAVQSLYANNELGLDFSDALIQFQVILKSNKITEAENFLTTRRNKLSGTVYLHYIEGMLAQAKGDFFLALNYYEVIIQSYKNHHLIELIEVYRRKGDLLFNEFQYFDKAIVEYRAAYNLSAQDQDILKMIACCIEMDEYDNASALLNQIKNKDSIDYLYLTGELYTQIGNEGKAALFFEKIIELAPNDKRSLLKRVLLYAWRQDFDGCINAAHESLTKLTERSVEHRDLLGNLGQLYLIKGDIVRANDCYEQIMALYPNCLDWFTERFVVLRQLNLHDRIIAQSEKLKLNKNVRINKTCFIHLAHAYFVKEKLEEAVACLQVVLLEMPYDLSAYELLIYIHLISNRLEEAYTYIDLSVKHHPNDPSGYNNKGMYFLFLKDLEKAKENYQKALLLAPEDLIAMKNLSAIASIEKQPDPKKAEAEMNYYTRHLSMRHSYSDFR